MPRADYAAGRHTQRIWTAQALIASLLMLAFLASCADSSPQTQVKTNHIVSTNSGTITYSTNPQDVLIRTFYGGGKLGTLAFSPEISIYGDGSYILGPGLQMREGALSSDALQQLLHTLVDTDRLLMFSTQKFYDVPDQNATLLELMLNGTHYEFLYGPFGNLSESTQELTNYHLLGKALTSIRNALGGPLRPYTNQQMALLVHQDFSPDLTQTIPVWKLSDFRLADLAIYECGVIPIDQTGPNADTGCLSYTAPGNALLLSAAQAQTIRTLLHGQQQGVFFESGQYYAIALRPLLPDELPQQTLAMLGSGQLSYSGVPLRQGPVPIATPGSP